MAARIPTRSVLSGHLRRISFGLLALTIVLTSTVVAVSEGASSAAQTTGIVGMAVTPDGGGYYLVRNDGAVFLFGDAQNHHDLYGQGKSGIVGMAVTPDGGGYYLVRNDGAVFLFGDAQNHGDLYGQGISGIVGMAVTPDGGGYYLVRSDGAVFLFGDAQNHGDLYGKGISGIVGMAVTPNGGGYYLVRNDGAVFLFGDAQNHGDEYGQNRSGIVGMSVTPDGGGYYLVRNDGALFLFGDAQNHGDLYGKGISGIVGMAVTPNGGGYYLVRNDGAVFLFGDAQNHGDLYQPPTQTAPQPPQNVPLPTQSELTWYSEPDYYVYNINGGFDNLSLGVSVEIDQNQDVYVTFQQGLGVGISDGYLVGGGYVGTPGTATSADVEHFLDAKTISGGASAQLAAWTLAGQTIYSPGGLPHYQLGFDVYRSGFGLSLAAGGQAACTINAGPASKFGLQSAAPTSSSTWPLGPGSQPSPSYSGLVAAAAQTRVLVDALLWLVLGVCSG
jgi:ribosomal protein L24E